MTQPLQRKIVAGLQITEKLRDARAAGRTVVQCHGCFDIVHPGHIRYLQFARQLGDVLVASLTGDALIQKGPDRPYIPQELRAENLAALEFVDWVVIDPHPTAGELLTALRPDVYVKGREYADSCDPRFLREREIVESYGGRVVFHSGDVVFSSTNLLQTMRRDQALDEHRLRNFCLRSGVNTAVLFETLEAFADVEVLVVGDIVRERYVLCDACGAAGDAPVLSLQRLGETQYWGGAAVVALQLRALGARPFLLTAAGRDETSLDVAAEFDELGVPGLFMPVRSGVVERTTFVADDAKLFKVNDGIAAPLDSAAEKVALGTLHERLAGAKLVLWCDYGYGMVTPGLVRAAAREIAGRRATSAGCAPGLRSELRGLHGADLLIATERQLREAMNDMSAGLPAVAWNLLHQTHGHSLIVALRKRGLIGLERQDTAGAPLGGQLDRLRSEFVPSLTTHSADLLGSEEAILATASMAVAVGAPLPIATYLAASADALAVSRPGAEHVKLADLHSWLAQRPELRPETRFLPAAVALTKPGESRSSVHSFTPDAARSPGAAWADQPTACEGAFADST